MILFVYGLGVIGPVIRETIEGVMGEEKCCRGGGVVVYSVFKYQVCFQSDRDRGEG